MPSNVISQYEYFAEIETLRIFFNSGSVYDYLRVPPEIFEEFRAYFGKGVYLNKFIKGKFEFRKVQH